MNQDELMDINGIAAAFGRVIACSEGVTCAMDTFDYLNQIAS